MAFGPSGETILEYSIFDAIRAGFRKVVFIVREEILEVAKEKFLPKLEGKIEVDWVIQSLDSFVPAELKQADRVKTIWHRPRRSLCQRCRERTFCGDQCG